MKLLIHTFDTYMIHFHQFIPNPFGIPESFTVLADHNNILHTESLKQTILLNIIV